MAARSTAVNQRFLKLERFLKFERLGALFFDSTAFP